MALLLAARRAQAVIRPLLKGIVIGELADAKFTAAVIRADDDQLAALLLAKFAGRVGDASP